MGSQRDRQTKTDKPDNIHIDIYMGSQRERQTKTDKPDSTNIENSIWKSKETDQNGHTRQHSY